MATTSEPTASTQAGETAADRRLKRTKRATLVRKIHAVARDRRLPILSFSADSGAQDERPIRRALSEGKR